MRLNEHTQICGQRVVLVPYEAQHVPKYHEWMSNEKLRELTASEPLALEKEYEMQCSWREDDDKLTFIVLSATLYKQHNDEIAAMVGDTNIFLHYDEEHKQNVGEVEIMIAAPEERGKGYGRESMLLMLKYACNHLKLDKFEARIHVKNAISLSMFESFRFTEVCRSDVFQEITLERLITSDWLAWLDARVQFKIEPYNRPPKSQ